MSNEINEIIETNKVTETETDPFDEALDDNIILDAGAHFLKPT